MATFLTNTINVNGKSIRYYKFECYPSEITIRTTTTALQNTSYYGTNGGFFDSNGLVCFAMSAGSTIPTGGNNNHNYSALVSLYSPMINSGPNTFVIRTSDWDTNTSSTFYPSTFPTSMNVSSVYTITQSNVRWAIGGLSLKILSNLSQSQFNSAVEDPGVDVTSNRPRTAIGVKDDGKIVLCAFFDATYPTNNSKGCSVWDVRALMQGFGVTEGVNIDGGSSAQVAWLEGTQRKTNYVTNNNVRSLVTVSM